MRQQTNNTPKTYLIVFAPMCSWLWTSWALEASGLQQSADFAQKFENPLSISVPYQAKMTDICEDLLPFCTLCHCKLHLKIPPQALGNSHFPLILTFCGFTRLPYCLLITFKATSNDNNNWPSQYPSTCFTTAQLDIPWLGCCCLCC